MAHLPGNNEGHSMVITIDGPAGSGKSTVARRLAERLDFFFLATGAMYRAVAWRCLSDGVPLADIERVAAAARALRLRSEGERLLADGRDITELIRANEVSEAASVVAVIPAVREALVGLQRQTAHGRNVVSEGRDQGTVVFPDAEHKFFLIADAEERARRRWEELERQGKSVDHAEVLTQLRQRDARDEGRAIAPMKPAADAIEIDTTGLDIEEVVTLLERHIRR
jgi:cytidylate kinase